jgi:hypothetical protein
MFFHALNKLTEDERAELASLIKGAVVFCPPRL